MSDSYQVIANLRLKHEYFNDKPVNALKFEISEEGMHIIQRYGLYVRQDANGLRFYSINPDLLSTASTADTIKIYLTQLDPRFFNYTTLPVDSRNNRIYWLRNSQNQHSPTDSILLHSEEFVNEGDMIRTNHGIYELAYDVSNTQIHFTDQFGNSIVQEDFEYNEDIGIGHFKFDREGMIICFDGDQEVDRFYQNVEMQRPDRFMVVEIGLHQLLTHYHENEIVNYLIQFQTRSTIWRYHVIFQGNKEYRSPWIEDTDQQYEFALPYEIEIADHQKAMVIESKTPIPLLIGPKYKFMLYCFELLENSDVKLEIPLPGARPDSLRLGPDASDRPYYSDIFIHI